MTEAKSKYREALALGVALVATTLSVSTVSASLVGTVGIQTQTDTTGVGGPASPGVPSFYDVKFTKVTDFTQTTTTPILLLPTLPSSALHLDFAGAYTLAGPPGLPAAVNYYYTSSSAFDLDFGAYGSGILKFEIPAGTYFVTAVKPTSASYSFSLALDPVGGWIFTPSPSGTPVNIPIVDNHFELHLTGGSNPGHAEFSMTSVPEPSTYLAGLGSMGLLGLFFFRQRK